MDIAGIRKAPWTLALAATKKNTNSYGFLPSLTVISADILLSRLDWILVKTRFLSFLSSIHLMRRPVLKDYLRVKVANV